MRRLWARMQLLGRPGVLIAALAAGCGQDGAGASQTTAAPAVSATAAAFTADRLQALRRCAAARERARQKSALPEEAYNELILGCADVYSAPECREAMLKTARNPLGPELAKVILACRAAYCPRFTEPKPELCSAKEEGNAGSAAQWQAFARRMLAHEMGVSEEELPKSLDAPWLDAPLPLTAATVTQGAAFAGIVLGLGANGAPTATVERDGERASFSLPEAPTTADFTPAARAAIRKGGAETRVVVRADKRVPHGVIVVLLDALKQEGVKHIAFSALPAP